MSGAMSGAIDNRETHWRVARKRSALLAAALALAAAMPGTAPAVAWPAADADPLDDLAEVTDPDLPFPDSGPAPGGWLFVLPVVTYAPETGLAFGASAGYQRQFSPGRSVRPSTLLPVVLLTARSQLIVGVLGDAWLAGDRWHLNVTLGYRRFPTLFYGVGDDTPAAQEESYTDLTGGVELELSRRLDGPLFGGLILHAQQTRLRDVEPGGLLAQGSVPGAAGGALWGLGLALAWDTRDAVQYPTRGWNQRLAVTRYLDLLGGDHVYTWTAAAISRYWPLGDRHVLAANVDASFKTGDVPFYELNHMGLRGYFEERHRERHAVRGQVELRSAVYRRLGAVAFAGLGELAATLDRLRLDEVRPMLGAGLRLNVGGERRANLAIDVGFGEGDSGVYIRFGEAF